MATPLSASMFCDPASQELAQELAQIRTMIVNLQARAAVLEAMPLAHQLHQEMLNATRPSLASTINGFKKPVH